MIRNRRTNFKPHLEALEERWCPAKPGPGAIEPTSTIHYSQFQIVEGGPAGTYENFQGYASMQGNGSNKLASPHYKWGGEPSRQMHGTRWIVAAEDIGGMYPSGTQRRELFATREDTGAKVQLTSDANIQMTNASNLRWAFDDSFISFAAVTWTPVTSGGNYTDATGAPWVVDAKVFRANISWSSGSPVAATPVAMLDAGLYFDSGAPDSFKYVRPDIRNLDWSPNGTQLVYDQTAPAGPGGIENRLHVITFDPSGNPGAPVLLATSASSNGFEPEWSPDGGRIAYSAPNSDLAPNLVIWTVRPDATGYFQVTNTAQNYDFDPKWSPDLDTVTAGYQGHIAFTRSRQSNQQGSTSWLKDVMRVPSTGGTPTNLSKDLAYNVYAAAWRAGGQVVPASPLLAASVGNQSTGEALHSDRLQPLLSEALSRWQAAGFNVSTLNNIDVRIADLGGTTLGMASGTTIWLDDNAAGWGWYLDDDPKSDNEFWTPGNQGEQNRMDLLTVLAHEVGHLLGYEHEEGVMQETLSAGERLTLHSEVI